MAYVISKHRQRVNVELDTVKTKLQCADDPSISSDLRDYAIAAAIFLAHAEFENYFVDALDGVANTYSHAAPDTSKLPAALRSHLISEKLGLNSVAIKIVARTGEHEVLQCIDKWFSSPDSVLLTGAQPLNHFGGEHIYGDYRYPSIKNIERVLRRIGVGDPKGVLNRQLRRDVIALLESIAGLRTALAHSATLPGVSILDVLARIDGLKHFIEALDRVLYLQVKSTLLDADWQSNMC